MLLPALACFDSPADPDPYVGHRFAQLSVGPDQACAIDSDGVAWCWGGRRFALAGVDPTTPVRVPGGRRWKRIATEGYRSCGITSEDAIYCWGILPSYLSGESVAGDTSSVPLLVDDDREWEDLSLGGFLCARTANGEAWCDGPRAVFEDGLTEVPGDIEWASISAGTDHVCGVAVDGTGYCFGRNSYGELGFAPADGAVAELPVEIGTDVTWQSLLAGFHFTCGITARSQAFCWGYNESGELGAPEPFETHEPVPPTYQSVHELTVSTGAWDARHVSCAGIGGFGAWGCWGDGSTFVEIPAPSAGRWDVIEAGILQACGLAAGRIYCWGYDWGNQSRIVLPDPNLIRLPDPV